MVIDVSDDDRLELFLSRLPTHPSHILCCAALGLNCSVTTGRAGFSDKVLDHIDDCSVVTKMFAS
jgi:hypothetical protein